MILANVKIDGSTEYFCRKKKRVCVIQGSFVGDGATLVACDMSDKNFLDLWTTEDYLLEEKETNEKN